MGVKFIFNPIANFDAVSQYDGEDTVAPTNQDDGYMSVVGDTLWYFAGGNRYKITATLDNPAVTFFLLEDGVSNFLLEDGTSKLLLEA